jgi:hypothetical protein
MEPFVKTTAAMYDAWPSAQLRASSVVAASRADTLRISGNERYSIK